MDNLIKINNQINNWNQMIKEIKPKGIKALNFFDSINLIIGWSIKTNKKYIIPSIRKFAKRLKMSKSYIHELENKWLNMFGFEKIDGNWEINPNIKKIRKLNYKSIKLFIFSTRKFKKAIKDFMNFKKEIGVEKEKENFYSDFKLNNVNIINDNIQNEIEQIDDWNNDNFYDDWKKVLEKI